MNESIKKILTAAFWIAREAPAEQSRYAGQVKVQWAEVHRIREALRELKIDWNYWDTGCEISRLIDAANGGGS
ncbi:MAG: hypothetical protein N2Z75_09560 [Meiothermus sp.]|nr:hypothetical protein [Meiothermus sp.]